MFTGNNDAKSEAYRRKFSDIVDQGAAILEVGPREAYREMMSRMGVVGSGA